MAEVVGVSLASGGILIVLLSCAKMPLVGGSPEIQIAVTADPNCNSCGQLNGNPLTIRILQVNDPSRIAGMGLVQLWDHEAKHFGDGLVGMSEQVVDPNTKATLKMERQAKAKAVILVGNFCKTEGTCWYLTKPLEGGGGISFKARVGQFCVTEPRS